MEALHAANPKIGADVAALSLHALAEILEKSRVARLTRHQHILLRIGELIAYAESAACLCRRAARAAEGKLSARASVRFDATALAAIARVFAREAALKVAEEGLRFIVGADGVNETELAQFETALNVPAIHRAQAGMLADMDFIGDVLYNRVAKRVGQAA